MSPSSAKTRRSTAGGSATQATTTSAASASSRGFFATFAPAACSAAARPGVRFQAVSGNPFFKRLAAMRPPMRPSPANPTRVLVMHRPPTVSLPTWGEGIAFARFAPRLVTQLDRDHHLEGAQLVGERHDLHVDEASF